MVVVGLPCTDKTPCRPCYGVPETDCGSAPRYHGSSLLASGRVGSFFPSPSCSPPQGGVQAVNLVAFKDTKQRSKLFIPLSFLIVPGSGLEGPGKIGRSMTGLFECGRYRLHTCNVSRAMKTDVWGAWGVLRSGALRAPRHMPPD